MAGARSRPLDHHHQQQQQQQQHRHHHHHHRHPRSSSAPRSLSSVARHVLVRSSSINTANALALPRPGIDAQHHPSPSLAWVPAVTPSRRHHVRPAHRPAKLSLPTSRAFNDPHEIHDRFTTSLTKRQEQQVSAVYRAQLADLSRPSSSSGVSTVTTANSLRRQGRLELQLGKADPPASLSRARASSLGPREPHAPAPPTSLPPPSSSPDPWRPPQPSRPPEPSADVPGVPSPSHWPRRRATSTYLPSHEPHPALRISKRTQSAVLWTLEEAIRKPFAFTPDLDEENAHMSDLTGGARASNGGARTAGPVAVTNSSASAGLRTPRDVMRDRQERERRRQEEAAAKAEEQRRLQAEERRRSAERRAQALSGDVPSRQHSLRASSQYSQDPQASAGGTYAAAGDRLSGGAGRVSSGAQYGQPTGRSSLDYTAPSGGRARGPSVSATDQPRAASSTSGGASRRTQPSGRRPAADPAPTSQAAAAADQTSGRGNTSTFPHAFERWELLSSHWEGITSSLLRQLEQNQDEILRTVPTAPTLTRQITDLSAAGANLFHAVVELQRLRASSERKFQRWFFETQAENERSQEVKGQLEKQLITERNARAGAAQTSAQNSIDAENARRELAEMRRELMISKEEARRAWEELGRRNQESLETAQSLKDGRVTVVSGLQVVPYRGGPSRTGSASQRPGTRESAQGYGVPGSGGGGGAGLGSPGDEPYYPERLSPTDTDPFTGHPGAPTSLHHEGGVQPLAAAGAYYPMGSVTGGPSTSQTVMPSTTAGGRTGRDKPQPPIPVTAEEAQQFYQLGSQEPYLRDTSQAQPSPAAVLAARTAAAAQQQREEILSQQSYTDTLSERDTVEYATDAQGRYLRDTQGHPIPLRGRVAVEASSEATEEEYDSDADRQREAELAAQYGRLGGGDVVPLQVPSAPATSEQAIQHRATTAAAEESPDYEGGEYDRWDAPQTMRHHHPTRLSDVLEEEEDRSSRRTAD